MHGVIFITYCSQRLDLEPGTSHRERRPNTTPFVPAINMPLSKVLVKLNTLCGLIVFPHSELIASAYFMANKRL
jgi:hypothetical protein